MRRRAAGLALAGFLLLPALPAPAPAQPEIPDNAIDIVFVTYTFGLEQVVIRDPE